MPLACLALTAGNLNYLTHSHRKTTHLYFLGWPFFSLAVTQYNAILSKGAESLNGRLVYPVIWRSNDRTDSSRRKRLGCGIDWLRNLFRYTTEKASIAYICYPKLLIFSELTSLIIPNLPFYLARRFGLLSLLSLQVITGSVGGRQSILNLGHKINKEPG